MKADITRRTFDPSRHFAAVVFGQGQVQVDADINEQEEIARHRVASLATDVIGATGVPKATGGFEVTVAPDGRDLLISTGHCYVDGILCENSPRVVPAAVGSPTTVTPSVAAPDGRPYAAGQWLEVLIGGTPRLVQIASVSGTGVVTLATAPAGMPAAGSTAELRRVTSYRSQPDRFVADPFDLANPDRLAAGAYRVELDVWHRHIGRVEDPTIGEVALGDAETATRVRVVWQVRLVPAGAVGAGSCALETPAAPGRLRASTQPAPPTDDPCELPDEAGYRGLENQLYRVEVHERTATTVVLKWQRDNGFVASRLTALGSTLTVQEMGRDPILGFEGAAFVEVTDDALELEQAPSDLLPVSGTDPVTRTITLSGAPSRAVLNRNARARRWDGRIEVTIAAPGGPKLLERGVQVALEPGDLRPGDYWLIPARTVTGIGGGTIEWPRDDKGNPLPKPPDGIAHHRVALAVVDGNGGAFRTAAEGRRECRPLFPPLTALTAADVSIDPTACGFTAAKTVQQAIDELCDRSTGLCTVVAEPGVGWEKAFSKVPSGGHARICFPIGSYPVTAKVTIAALGHLVLEGAGFGSVLSGPQSETVLEFTGCTSVTVRNLSVEGGSAAGSAGLTGALSFVGCNEVTVDTTRVSSVGRPEPQASCIRISGPNTLVRIEHSRFEVGDRQVGIALVDVARAVVTDNLVEATGNPASALAVPGMTKAERDRARRLLFADLRMVPVVGKRVGVTVEGRAMSFATSGPGTALWPALLGGPFSSMRALQIQIDRVLRSLFTGAPVAGAAGLVAFLTDRVVNRRATIMSQGILVAGRGAADVRVERNTIVAAIQGVHAAVSHVTGPLQPDRLDRVVVADNQINVLVPPDHPRGRHAIFVGNARTVRIENNDLQYESRVDDDRVLGDGIRVFGYVGRQLLLRANVLDNFPGGISVTGLSREPANLEPARVWAAEDNVLAGARSPFIRTGGVLGSKLTFRGNRPGPVDTLDPRYQLKTG